MVSYPGFKFDKGYLIPAVPKGCRVDFIVDFCMGNGGSTLQAKIEHPDAMVLGAERYETQRAWLTASEETRQKAKTDAERMVRVMRKKLDKRWDGKGTYGEQYPESWAQVGKYWLGNIKAPLNRAIETGRPSKKALAALLVVQCYSYAGFVRTSKNGINSSPNAQKLRKDNVVLPRPVPVSHVHKDALEIPLPGRNTLGVFDMPYWMHRSWKDRYRTISQCYPDHKGHSDELYELAVKVIDRALKSNMHTLIVYNYDSPEFETLINSYSLLYGYSVTKKTYGELQSQNKKRQRTSENVSVNVHRHTRGQRMEVYSKVHTLFTSLLCQSFLNSKVFDADFVLYKLTLTCASVFPIALAYTLVYSANIRRQTTGYKVFLEMSPYIVWLCTKHRPVECEWVLQKSYSAERYERSELMVA